MGEMGSMVSGIMGATKGPQDPGIQQTTPATAGPYSPTARTGNMMAALGGSDVMSDAPPLRLSGAVGRQPDAPQPTELAQYKLSAGGPPPAPPAQSVSAPAGIFSNVGAGGPVSTEGAPEKDRYNIPA